MKKHDEGYVLAYVTVVLLVFCLVATVILTGALRNLQNQQNTITQMKDQYAAEGMIEQVMAQWDDCQFTEDEPVKIGETATEVICTAKDTENGTVTLYAESGTVSITCEVQTSDGKYISYNIGTATPETTGPVPTTTGGAGG